MLIYLVILGDNSEPKRSPITLIKLLLSSAEKKQNIWKQLHN